MPKIALDDLFPNDDDLFRDGTFLSLNLLFKIILACFYYFTF